MVFYEPGKTDHNLAHDPFKACVIPRPIGWISTTSPDGKTHNLAPYSQFTNLTFDPPYVMFSANQSTQGLRKDTTINTEASGKFCWNLATYKLKDHVNISAEETPYGVDEFQKANLEKCFSTILPNDDKAPCPMVAASPVRFECEYHSTIRLPGVPPMGTVDIVIGRVLGVHIAEDVLTDGKLDVRKTEPIARCGYYEYAVVRETFEMVIPGMNEAVLAGLEGNAKKQRLTKTSGVGNDCMDVPLGFIRYQLISPLNPRSCLISCRRSTPKIRGKPNRLEIMEPLHASLPGPGERQNTE